MRLWKGIPQCSGASIRIPPTKGFRALRTCVCSVKEKEPSQSPPTSHGGVRAAYKCHLTTGQFKWQRRK